MTKLSRLATGIAAAAALTVAGAAFAGHLPIVGGAPMDPEKPIAVNASAADNLTTLVAAAKAADLVDTLAGPGPFTVFAPTDSAFGALPEGTVEQLLQPDMKPQLQHVLTYHVVPGTMTAADLMAKVEQMGGKFSMETVSGDTLTVQKNGPGPLVVIDEMGNGAVVSQADVMQSNGVVHVVDAVLMPAM